MTEPLYPILVEMDEYEVANLRQGLLTLRKINLDTGDWLGQLLNKLPETDYPPNMVVGEQLARVRGEA